MPQSLEHSDFRLRCEACQAPLDLVPSKKVTTCACGRQVPTIDGIPSIYSADGSYENLVTREEMLAIPEQMPDIGRRKSISNVLGSRGMGVVGYLGARRT